jgi:release factor glutamine methyltransferase
MVVWSPRPLFKLPPVISVGGALARAAAVLKEAGVPSPELDALLLLTEELRTTKASVLAHPERMLSERETAGYERLIDSRQERMPFAYIVGHREFYGREFCVGLNLLIPRPETELLVEVALDYLRRQATLCKWAADVGTGTGVLAITLAAEHPTLCIVATDRSKSALEVSYWNALRLGVQHAVFTVQTDLLAGVKGPLGIVVANLPYIPTNEIDGLMPEVSRYEPRLALDGGPDGLALNRRLLAQAATRLAPGGLLLLEMDSDQGPDLRAEAERLLPNADLAIVKDLAGHDRVLRVQLPST